MQDDELERFKESVSITTYAESVGWTLDRKKSSSTVKVYRLDSDKMLVWVGTGRVGTGRYDLYRNERDHADRGSIVDFVKSREGCSLGRARMVLRGYLGIGRQEHSFPSCPSSKPRVPASQEQGDGYRKKTLAVWNAARWNPEPTYLLGRGLTSATLTTPRFVDTFRTDTHGNVVFLHNDRRGPCGYDRRGPAFKGIGQGVLKALWYSKNIREAKQIALCESPIDCMSHYQIHGGDLAYVSISGEPSALQRDLLTGLLLKAADRQAKVYSAFDNDPGGDKYSEMMSLLSPEPLERLKPITKDWNSDIQNGSRYWAWRVMFLDGRSTVIRETEEPSTFDQMLNYCRSLTGFSVVEPLGQPLSLIHISEPTRPY